MRQQTITIAENQDRRGEPGQARSFGRDFRYFGKIWTNAGFVKGRIVTINELRNHRRALVRANDF